MDRRDGYDRRVMRYLAAAGVGVMAAVATSILWILRERETARKRNLPPVGRWANADSTTEGSARLISCLPADLR